MATSPTDLLATGQLMLLRQDQSSLEEWTVLRATTSATLHCSPTLFMHSHQVGRQRIR